MLIDSHCHLNMLDLTPFDGQLENVLDAGKKLNVEKFICVAVDLNHDQELKNIAENHQQVFITAGVHPSEAPGETVNFDLLKQQA